MSPEPVQFDKWPSSYDWKIIVSDINSLGNLFFMFCCRLLFFQNKLFQKNLSGKLSECQTVWIQIRRDILSVLIWVPTACKSYQQMTKVAAFRNTIRVSNSLDPDQDWQNVDLDLGQTVCKSFDLLDLILYVPSTRGKKRMRIKSSKSKLLQTVWSKFLANSLTQISLRLINPARSRPGPGPILSWRLIMK